MIKQFSKQEELVLFLKAVNRITLILFIVLLILLSIVWITNTEWFLKKRYPLKYATQIFHYSGENRLDPYLVASVILEESKFNPRAVSSKGAIGLMQIMPDTGKWVAEQININNYNSDMLFDPETNIKIGTWHLANLMEEFNGELVLVMAAYNGGSGNVNQWLQEKTYSRDGKTLKHIPFKETRDYVKKIKKTYEIYKKLYEKD
ncbi:MAG: soluble lytic murein transglycosylase [Thermosediminibacterales bacterium]|nr:soluble lytic murein transglycosylase [Thermosediminibacterales bacterium]MDK2835276.1 soluble lytic murein transglycosylase [Thermosediminibacterales bacterium]